MSEDTDNLLIALAQRCGGIEAMFDSLFSFLKRKTDFYHIQQPGDKIGAFVSFCTFGIKASAHLLRCAGFPEGKAEALLLKAYRKYLSDKVAPAPRKEAFVNAQRLNSHETTSKALADTNAKSSQSPIAPIDQTVQPIKCSFQNASEPQPAGGDTPNQAGQTAQRSSKPDAAGVASGNSFVPYNGGMSSHYRWSQTLSEVVRPNLRLLYITL